MNRSTKELLELKALNESAEGCMLSTPGEYSLKELSEVIDQLIRLKAAVKPFCQVTKRICDNLDDDNMSGRRRMAMVKSPTIAQNRELIDALGDDAPTDAEIHKLFDERYGS